jgi:hypothetical protein
MSVALSSLNTKEVLAMRGNRHINTTLGELIAAVTDEVMPIAGNQANADALVSYILNDLLVAKKLKLKSRRATLRV